MELAEYKKYVADTLESLLASASPYRMEQSPLKPEEVSELSERLEKTKRECRERLEKFRPKIMLYGVYNSGKSTLLNALLGENKAEIGDIPKTYKVESYDWKGHEIIDTPGIDAPIEHETISREALRSSQIIAFVVSSKGSFENKKIYEAMRDVVDQGKKLIIILNDKDSVAGQEELAEIKDRIQSILEKQGFSRQTAASFRLTPVNAKFALDGRLDGEEQLVNCSGISEVEELFIDELKNHNGYDFIKDSLNYLLVEYKFFLGILERQLKLGEKSQDEAFLELREYYHNFRASLENDIDNECASLPGEISHCFPTYGKVYDSDNIRDCIEATLQNYVNAINGKMRQEYERFQTILLRQGNRILQNGEATLNAKAEIENLEDLLSTLANYQREGNAGSSPNYEPEADLIDKIGDTASILSTLPLMKLPVPLPIPPIVLSALLVGIKVVTSIFGRSQSEKDNERMRAQINYEREMAERQARAQERQREEIRAYSETTKNKFARSLKITMRESVEKSFKPVLNALENQCNATKDMDAEIRREISSLYETIREIESHISELS